MASEVLAVVLMVAVVFGLAASVFVVLEAPMMGGTQVREAHHQAGTVEGRWDGFDRCATEPYEHMVSDKHGWHQETGTRLMYPELCHADAPVRSSPGSPPAPVPRQENVSVSLPGGVVTR